MQMKIPSTDKIVSLTATFGDIYRKHYGKIAVILQRNLKIFTIMTPEEEKKAQEAAAAAAAEQAGGEAGGETGSQEGGGEAGNGGNNEGGEGSIVTPRDENGAPVVEPMPKDVFFERIRTNSPDAKFDGDEQEYYRRALALLDKAEEGSKKYDGLTEKMMRRYKEDPEEVAILMDYIEGMPLITAIRKHKGDEALTMKEGDEGWEEYQRVGEARKADRERYEKLMGEIEANMGTTVSEFTSWADGKKLDDEQKMQIWKSMQDDLDNMSRGKFTNEMYERYLKALNYENDVEGAHEQGKAEGKNEAIEAEQGRMAGSGLPGMNAGSVQEREPEEQPKKSETAAFLHGIRRR